MNNTNIPIPSQSFHTYNMQTTPMKTILYYTVPYCQQSLYMYFTFNVIK